MCWCGLPSFFLLAGTSPSAVPCKPHLHTTHIFVCAEAAPRTQLPATPQPRPTNVPLPPKKPPASPSNPMCLGASSAVDCGQTNLLPSPVSPLVSPAVNRRSLLTDCPRLSSCSGRLGLAAICRAFRWVWFTPLTACQGCEPNPTLSTRSVQSHPFCFFYTSWAVLAWSFVVVRIHISPNCVWLLALGPSTNRPASGLFLMP